MLSNHFSQKARSEGQPSLGPPLGHRAALGKTKSSGFTHVSHKLGPYFKFSGAVFPIIVY